MAIEPDCDQTLVSLEEVDALTPAARQILNDSIRKAHLDDLEQGPSRGADERWETL